MNPVADETTNGPDRIGQLRAWLSQALPKAGLSPDNFTLTPASSDASFRRYFRVGVASGTSLIAMDAPPDKENCAPFIAVARVFRDAGVHVPDLVAQEIRLGFLLLSDMGTTTYLDRLLPLRADKGPEAPGAIDALYRDAIASLVDIQRASRVGVLPEYDRTLLERELRLLPEWYVRGQLHATLTASQNATMEAAFEAILKNNLAQPRVYVHRDYHSRNLMVCPRNPGILDFQDAVFGPITYDLVSLLRDAYVGWEEEQVIDWCIRYWEQARRAGLPVPRDFGDFYRDFEWMGAQRQIKVLGIFARLALRDGKTAYLRDQPLIRSYLMQTCRRYRELAGFAQLLDQLEGGAGASAQQ